MTALAVSLSLAFGLTPTAFAQTAAGSTAAATTTASSANGTPAQQLEAVTVTGGILGDLAPVYAGGQVATGGSMGILGSTDVMDTPFSTVNYTSQLLYDQQARTLADVVVNDASVRMLTSSGGFSEDFQMRGFAVNSSDVSVNGLYGLVSSSRVPVQIMDRVEVLKGPGAFMRGIPPGGSIGGAINIVTKRAEDEPLARATLGYASKSNFTGQLDLARRFGQDNAWGLRFNGVKRGGEATLRDGKQGLDMGALGIDYRGSRLRWSADVIHQEDAIDGVRSQIGWLSTLTALPSPPDGDINFYPGTRLTQRDTTVMSRLEYDVTDNITAHIAGGYREGDVRQVFPENVSPALQRLNVDGNGNFNVRTNYYDSYTKTRSGDTGISARFNTGPVKHRVALGATYMNQDAGNAFSPGTEVVPSNIYNPTPIPAGPANRVSPAKASETTLSSFALADTMSFFDDRILVTAGARRQTVDVDSFNTGTGVRTSGYRATATSPIGGIVVKPLGNVSIYANYAEGLTRGTIVGNTYANRGEVLAPFKSKQYETGVKVDWGSLTTTVALYQIARPAGQENADNVYGYFGEQRNRGLEITGFGEITRSLRMMASAAYIDSELTKTQGGVNQGNRPAGVPASTYSLGLDWDTPWVQGLSLNGRTVRTSSVYLNNTNTLRLSGYTRFDVGARYATKIAGKDVVLRANVENLTDRKYWLASGSFATNAAGRNYMLSASINY
ncbi:MAG: TonB-dependent siderophore receptor [Burkholderiaceae bacterium]|nr:TonB-dependent siderophore receptor [Burkholderiaceae bacterium]